MRDMDNIYIKSIQAVQKVMINDKHCFELYPYSVTMMITHVIYTKSLATLEQEFLGHCWS